MKKRNTLTKASSVTYLAAAVLGLVLASCSKDGCEENITGTLVVENTSANATLEISINGPFASINGPGDLSVAPGERASIDTAAGPLEIFARFSQTVCENGRCSVSTQSLPNRNADLETCESIQLVY